MTDVWQGLIATALVGTARQAPSLGKGQKGKGRKVKGEGANSESDLMKTLHQLDWQQPESALLAAAGAIALYQQVGNKIEPPSISKPNTTSPSATVATSTPKPCEPDVLPACRPRISKYIGIVLEEHSEALPELLELIASAQKRVPPKWLPKLLNYGKKNVSIRPQILPVLGNRGRWLASQNPAWRYAHAIGTIVGHVLQATDFSADTASIEEAWTQGNQRDRLLLFQQWRTEAPSAARDALAADWKSEIAIDREAFLAAFAPQLSMEDEPFLEQALSDRAKGVRQQAIDLLLQLPESGLCQRMATRANRFVTLQTQSQRLRIQVILPNEYAPEDDTEWTRDGIPKKPRQSLGEKASWLWAMIAGTPLDHWQQTGQVTPEEILEVAIQNEWKDVLVSAWAIAAQRQRRADWTAALLSQLGETTQYAEVLAGSIHQLSPAQQEAYMRSQIPPKKASEASDEKLAHWLRLVACEPQRWNFEFSRVILSQLMRLLKGKRRYGELFRPPVSLALTLHPGLAPEASQLIGTFIHNEGLTRSWERFLDKFLALLKLRWEIYQAFANSRKQ